MCFCLHGQWPNLGAEKNNNFGWFWGPGNSQGRMKTAWTRLDPMITPPVRPKWGCVWRGIQWDMELAAVHWSVPGVLVDLLHLATQPRMVGWIPSPSSSSDRSIFDSSAFCCPGSVPSCVEWELLLWRSHWAWQAWQRRVRIIWWLSHGGTPWSLDGLFQGKSHR